MLGNNSCGVHSLLAAKHGRGLRTADNTHELEILTYDGLRLRVGETAPDELERIIRGGRPPRRDLRPAQGVRRQVRRRDPQRFPKLPRRVSGYNLDALLPENGFHVARALVGSEGTLVTILEATLRPGARTRRRASLLVLGYPGRLRRRRPRHWRSCRFKPTGLEGIDHLLFEYDQEQGRARRRTSSCCREGKGFLLVEFGGDSKEDADDQARRCMEMLKKQQQSADDEAVRRSRSRRR